MKIVPALCLVFLSIHSNGQILKRLKDKAVDKAKTNTIGRAKSEAHNAYYDQVNKIRAEFDSTDFDYAILVSDNSGLFNVKDKREIGGKFMTLKNVGGSLLHGDIDISDEENARLNLHMGESSFAMGRYLFAEKRLTAATAYFEKAGLLSDPGYMKSISDQGLLYATVGRFTQAEKFTSQALDLRKQHFKANDMGIAASLNNYAVLHYNLGQYNESEKLFDEALSVIKANGLQVSVPYGIVLNNQAILFQAIGRYEVAEKNMKEVISIGESRGAAGRPANRLRFFSNLALLYQQMGKYKEAESIYLKMESRIADKTKPEYANMLDNYAILCLVMGTPERVEDMLRHSSAIYKSSFGESSPAYAKVISDLGNFYRYKSRYPEAEPLLKQALNVREQTLGVNHPLYAQSQEDLAILYWKMGSFNQAAPLYHDAMERSLDFINRYFGPMSEAEKTKYWDLLSPRFQRFYNFALEAAPANPQLLTDMFEYRVATKGLLLSSTRKINASILASGNQQLITDYAAWVDQKEELARLYVFSKEELQEQNMNIDSMESACNAMEKKLSGNSKEFSKFFFTTKTGFSEIQKKLKGDEALVEIIRLRDFGQILTDSSKYICLIVSKDNPQPAMVLLSNGNMMEKTAFRTYRRAMINKLPDEQSYIPYWSGLEPALKGKKKIYVSVDGIYNQINLYTLKKGGDFLINQVDIVLLGNPRDLVLETRIAKTTKNKNATLIGYPDYASDKIPELPATKNEVDDINKLLKASGYQVDEFTQKDATEENLKLAKEVSVLHIATHGYFFQDVEKAYWPIGVHADNAKENVLLRSGLMLTGASSADDQIPDLVNNSNGIITSYEAMNLDLEGTRLVVLSACETGLGEVKAGEGVYGLQRAFLVAGAEAIIMSLWRVDDVPTKELMTFFYTNWVAGGDKQKAFKQAQQQLMKKYPQPYYWGAFVIVEN
jgi:CHAT domain-containing protein/Tfp pilus assembly protein PilF